MYGQDFTLTVKVVDASDNTPLDGYDPFRPL